MQSTISLDFLFADERVDSTHYGSSWTLLDYDIAIWHPTSLLNNYKGTGLYDTETTFQGLPSLSDDSSAELLRDTTRRRAEMAQFLDLGRTLIIFVPPPQPFFCGTGKKEHSGTGKNRRTTRIVDEMDLEQLAFPFDIKLTRAAGAKMRLVGGEPFASFWRTHRERFYYEAHMELESDAVVVIEGTEYPVASVARVEKGGLVLLLPQLDLAEAPFMDDDSEAAVASEKKRSKVEAQLLDGLFDLVAAYQKTSGDFSMPEWAGQVVLPQEQDALDGVSKTQGQLAKLEKKLTTQRAALSTIQERKLLLVGTGVALEAVCGQAFEALGFKVETGPPGGADLILRDGSKVAVVEVKGKTKTAAKADASQLEGWVTDYELEHGVQPKAILVATAWRDTPLADRPDEAFPDSMRSYSEKRDHCLITGPQLLGAWLDAEKRPRSKKPLRESILGCVGRYEGYSDWREFVDLQSDAPQPGDQPDSSQAGSSST